MVRKLPDGRELWGRIVETEAYLGGEDEASHSKGGKQTQRNAAMFMKPGTLYVYQIYGIYFCMNVSSQGKLRLKEVGCQQDGADSSSYRGAAVTCELSVGSLMSLTCCHDHPLGPGLCHCDQGVPVDMQHSRQGPSPAAQFVPAVSCGSCSGTQRLRNEGKSG